MEIIKTIEVLNKDGSTIVLAEVAPGRQTALSEVLEELDKQGLRLVTRDEMENLGVYLGGFVPALRGLAGGRRADLWDSSHRFCFALE